MPKDIEDIKDDITDLRVDGARYEERLNSLEHKSRNQTLVINALDQRIAKLEGGIAWLLRMAIAIGTGIGGAIYAWAKKVGLV